MAEGNEEKGIKAAYDVKGKTLETTGKNVARRQK